VLFSLVSGLREQVKGLGAVVFGGAGVGADGVEAGVAEQVGDDNKVGAAADECGGEGVGGLSNNGTASGVSE
jgi:hypothetical protein